MLELCKINKKYDDETILENIDYKFNEQGLVCILGPSGSGKTTLMNLIAGIDHDYNGTIKVDGTAINTLNEKEICNYRKDYIGFIFQDYQLLNGYTVIENILYPCVLNDTMIVQKVSEAKTMLVKLGLADKENELVQNLSGGQKQRVAIARALIKDPKIILADEPTGAVDRQTADEIMAILKEIAKTKLVIVITHDQHICDYADEILRLEDKKLIIEKKSCKLELLEDKKMQLIPAGKIKTVSLALKNFKVSFLKYFIVAVIFSLGIVAMMFSLSSNDIIENSIHEFKEKNIVFNNGYIKNNGDDKLYAKLLKDLRLENVYQQYVIHDVQLLTSNHQEILSEKYPMPKTKETLSYGTMPRINKNEIALSPSLAKKFNSKINQLIGKEIKLKYQNHDHKLTISGIYNAGYDDFFVSSDIERQLYNNFNDEYYSISYDVKNFDDIVTVSQQMQEHNIQSENASEQVGMLQESFHKLKTIFYLISIMILFVAIFIVIVILLKLQNKRYQMIGLLYSFGFEKQIINQLVIFENFWLILLTGVITTLLVIISQILAPTINLSINFTLSKYLITIITSIVIMVVINFIISRKLINTNLAEALRK